VCGRHLTFGLVKALARRRPTVKAFVKKVYEEYVNDAVADRAAALSYYFVFALFPTLFFLITLAAYIPYVRSSAMMLLDRMHAFLPGQATSIIDAQVHDLLSKPRPHALGLGLLAAVYSASRGVQAVRGALNVAYDVTESRPFWKTEALAFGMTIGGTLLVLFGITALVVGGDAGFWIARQLHLDNAYVVVWRWLRWPITALAIMLSAALAYYLLPDVKQRFKFITPGSIIGTLVWLAACFGFDAYVSHFGSYNVTYGSIGGVVVLMTWFYLTGLIFLMGGEINAILEHWSADGKAPGARAEGEAPLPAAERPSAMPAGAADSAEAADRAVDNKPSTGARVPWDGRGTHPEGTW
jgi:membrane protein